MRCLTLLLSLLLCTCASAQQLDWVDGHPGTIRYSVDISNAQQHELDISVTFPAVPPGVFTIKMPQASPGRYAQHNFAKNVYDLQAYSSTGDTLAVHPAGVAEWQIAGHDGAVRLEYTLFANDGDGTYSGVDDRKLHLNMPATFLYGEGLNDRPILIDFGNGQRRDEWEVASQLVPVNGEDRFRAAPNYYYFYDSPTLVGEMMRTDWTVTNPNGETQTIELAMMHEGSQEAFDEYVEWAKAIVLEQQKIFGELPRFDFGRYTFLCSYNPYISGDGMEHRNSTICSAPFGLEDRAKRLIGTLSHEFFHCWNVERIRPASLEPFEFDHANRSGELWFAEGFTSYFDDLVLTRAGIITPEEYADNLTGQLNYVLNSPGRDHRGPIAMSQQAPFVDAATANDPDNFGNTFVSYYSYGATLGLALDLELRNRGKRLDEVMQLMWEWYGEPEIPYHIRDIQFAVGAVAGGDHKWAKRWFERHVYGSTLPDLAALMGEYGLELKPTRPDSVGFYGLGLREEDGVVTVSRPVPENSPLYAAGLDQGSEIVAVNGTSIVSVADWEAAVAGLKLGATYDLKFEQLGREKTGRFTASASPELSLRVVDEPDESVRTKRVAWLNY